jgi:AmmeMemoRadiSam system protein B
MEKKAPRLRLDMDIVPMSYRGENVFLVKDMLGLIPQTILLKGEALQIIRLIDGKRDIRDIQMELMRMHGGVIIRADEVEEMISQLDRAFLLDSDHYRKEKTRIIAEYGKKRNREAALAGKAYPEDPDRLASDIQSILGGQEARTGIFEGKKIRALIAPHIDLEVGKEVYAKAYQVLRGFSPRKILLLGTGHNLQDHYFSLTTKDFITPLGWARTDRDSIERLKETSPSGIIAPHDIDHKNEHSLEFQILFLQGLFGDDFELIPVLCGSFHRVLQKVTRPADIPGLADFLAGLRTFLGENEGDVLIVAGVDFSHIGPKFGHREAASSLLLEAKAHDRSLIDAICRGDVTGFWSETRKAHNKYNVCGFSALALLLELLPGGTGSLLGYDFWMEEATQSAVSFAALALFE